MTTRQAGFPSRGALVVLAASCVFANVVLARPSSHSPADGQILELKRSFTLSGKAVPPLVFRDLGDGNLADSENALDSIDLIAATGSNAYSADITDTGWISQHGADGSEEGYRFIGTTANGLVAVVSRFSGGGSGTFYFLHIVALEAGKRLDAGGHRRDRIDLKTVRSIPLGDRWVGDVRIEGNSLIVRSDRRDNDGRSSGARRISAERP